MEPPVLWASVSDHDAAADEALTVASDQSFDLSLADLAVRCFLTFFFLNPGCDAQPRMSCAMCTPVASHPTFSNYFLF